MSYVTIQHEPAVRRALLGKTGMGSKTTAATIWPLFQLRPFVLT